MMMTGHIVFDGPTKTAKYWVKQNGLAVLKHTIEMHDVGILDGTQDDPYGHECKCPPGMYFVGAPQSCAIRQSDGSVRQVNSDDPAYGCFFTPLYDNPADPEFAKHDRGGIGMHGGGSGSPTPFAMHQGWYATLGCLRMQNIDNEMTHVPFVNYIRAQNPGDSDHCVTLTVYWGPRG